MTITEKIALLVYFALHTAATIVFIVHRRREKKYGIGIDWENSDGEPADARVLTTA